MFGHLHGANYCRRLIVASEPSKHKSFEFVAFEGSYLWQWEMQFSQFAGDPFIERLHRVSQERLNTAVLEAVWICDFAPGDVSM